MGVFDPDARRRRPWVTLAVRLRVAVEELSDDDLAAMAGDVALRADDDAPLGRAWLHLGRVLLAEHERRAAAVEGRRVQEICDLENLLDGPVGELVDDQAEYVDRLRAGGWEPDLPPDAA